MKMNRHFPTVLRLLLLAAMAMGLSGCLSHWITDSTTRLQIENKTSHVFLGLDIIAEDGSSVIPWVQDSLEPGERSRVFEADFVGKFNVQIKYAGWELYQYECGVIIEQPHGYVLAKSSNEVAAENIDRKRELCSVSTADPVVQRGDFEFVGGSVYLVLTENEDGSTHLQTK